MKIRFFTLHTLLPIIIGGVIYTCWRSHNLLVFSWYNAIGFEEVVNNLRFQAFIIRAYIPNWVMFSLPDGLWVYAITTLMTGIWWESEFKKLRFAWTSLGLVLGAGGEIGQLLRIVPGTFDLRDLLLCCFASVAAITATYLNKGKEQLCPNNQS